MTQIQIGFGAVIGHIALTVLVGIKRARINIDVRVKLLDCNSETSGLQQLGQLLINNTLSERRNNSAGNKYKFCLHNSSK